MNQTKLLTLLSIITVLTFSSCLRDLDLESDLSDAQLVVIAELEEGVQPTFRVSTTFPVNSSPEEFDGDFAEVVITDSKTDFEDRQEFRPVTGTNLFTIPSDLIPEQGVRYSLDVEVQELEIPSLTGETVMPERGSIETVNSISVISDTDRFTELSVSLDLGELPDPESYYHLIPFVVDNNGTPIFPDINAVQLGANASTVLRHRHGMLIDIKALGDLNSINFNLRSLLPLDIDNLNDKNLYFKLNTVAEEYFLYHTSISRQFESQTSIFTLPTISYTQFENGFGIFTAFSTETTKFAIR
jgi:hypothetical protein